MPHESTTSSQPAGPSGFAPLSRGPVSLAPARATGASLPIAGTATFVPVTKKSQVHEHDGIACACGHDHGSEEGHSHSGVGLDFQLTVLLPLSIACLVLAEVFGGREFVKR